MIDRRILTGFELWFILVILLIQGMGVLSIFSVTYNPEAASGLPVYAKQIAWIAIGWGSFLLFAFYDYRKMTRYSFPFYGLCIAMLVLVLFFGRTGGGAQRWLSLGLFNVQPSEWIKVSLILVVAKYFSGRQQQRGLNLASLIAPSFLLLVPLLLVLKQPDLGTALAILFLFAVMVFLAGFQSKRVGFSALISLMAFPFVWEIFWNSLKDYQRNRLSTFFNPSQDPMGVGYHALQSKIAIGSGGLLGKGLWGGTQSQLKFLPEGHTDFIFAVFAEEWGFIGVLVLFTFYFLLIAWAIRVALRAKDTLGSLIAGGVVAMLLFSVLVNIAMTAGVAPVVGVPLPLMSYGGNSLVTTMATLGLLLNIRTRRFMLFY
jgi:rod shape determining protein RodA